MRSPHGFAAADVMRLSDAARRGAKLIHARVTNAIVPFHVVACVTARCNLRCVYCSCPSRRDDELTVDEWCRVLDECRALGTERVQFYGGEPLLRDDLGRIAAHARQMDLHCVLATNGLLVPKRREVVSLMHTVVMSLDGGERAHDANRGHRSHARTLEAIDALQQWKVPVKLNAVLNANNAEDVEWLVEFTRDRGIPLSLNVMRSGTPLLWNKAEQHRLAQDSMRQLIARIIEVKRHNPHVVFSRSTYDILARWSDFARDRLDENEGGRNYGQARCSAGRFHCLIYSDGRLFPCALTVKQLPALDVRRSGVAAALMQAGRHSCASCASACLIEMNRLFALDARVLASLAYAYLTRDIA